MHRVQAQIRRGAPAIMARTRCKLGSKERLVTLWAWLMRLPKVVPLPQSSHFLAMIYSSLKKLACIGKTCRLGTEDKTEVLSQVNVSVIVPSGTTGS